MEQSKLKKILKILLIFVIVVVTSVAIIKIFFIGKKSKAAVESVKLTFNPALKIAPNGTNFAATVQAQPSIDMSIKLYMTKIAFEKDKVQVTGINYKFGRVTQGLGDDNTTLADVNARGSINIYGEIQETGGAPLTASSPHDLVELTFTSISSLQYRLSFDVSPDLSGFTRLSTDPQNPFIVVPAIKDEQNKDLIVNAIDNLQVNCDYVNKKAVFSWTNGPLINQIKIRIDDISNPWSDKCDEPNPGDFCSNDNIFPNASYQFDAVSGTHYKWWLNVEDPGAHSDDIFGPAFSCQFESTTPPVIETPVPPTAPVSESPTNPPSPPGQPPSQPGGNTLLQTVVDDDKYHIYWRACPMNADGWPNESLCTAWDAQDWSNKRGAGNERYLSVNGYVLNSSTFLQTGLDQNGYSVYWRICGMNSQGWPDENTCGVWTSENWSNKRGARNEKYLNLNQYLLNTTDGQKVIQMLLDDNGHTVYWRACGMNSQGWPDETLCGGWSSEEWSNMRSVGNETYMSVSGYILNTSGGPVLIQTLLNSDKANVYWRYCGLNSDGWPSPGLCNAWSQGENWSNKRGVGNEKYKSIDSYLITAANNPPPGNTTLNIKLRFQGITGRPVAGSQMDVVVKVAGGNLSQPLVSGPVTFTVDDGGIWSGTAGFDLTESANYRVYIKGPKHIQKRICDNAPAETWPGTYRCFDGKISLRPGQNSLDFSNILQLVGDLPVQDGIVNAYDISLIRNNLTSRDAEILRLADLNLDGVVDTQDHSLVISALSVKYDDE